MKQWYVSIAAFFSLGALVTAQCIPQPLYAALAGVSCALVAAVFLGMILSENAKSKLAGATRSESERQKRLDEMHRELTEQIGAITQGLSSAETALQSIHSILNAFGPSLDQRMQNQHEARREWTEQICGALSGLTQQESGLQDLLKQQGDSVNQNLVKLQDLENRLQKEMLAELAKQESDLHQMLKRQGNLTDQNFTALRNQEERLLNDTARTITEATDKVTASIDLQHKLWKELSELVASQRKMAESFFVAMLKKPGIANDISETLESIKGAAEELRDAIEEHPQGTVDKLGEVVDKIGGLGASIKELRESLERQGTENKETIQAFVDSYSSVTEQDLSVLKALSGVKDNG